MTTAARPTFEPARGGRGKGEGDLSALSKQYSSRDLPSHTKLKYRWEPIIFYLTPTMTFCTLDTPVCNINSVRTQSVVWQMYAHTCTHCQSTSVHNMYIYMYIWFTCTCLYWYCLMFCVHKRLWKLSLLPQYWAIGSTNPWNTCCKIYMCSYYQGVHVYTVHVFFY